MSNIQIVLIVIAIILFVGILYYATKEKFERSRAAKKTKILQ